MLVIVLREFEIPLCGSIIPLFVRDIERWIRLLPLVIQGTSLKQSLDRLQLREIRPHELVNRFIEIWHRDQLTVGERDPWGRPDAELVRVEVPTGKDMLAGIIKRAAIVLCHSLRQCQCLGLTGGMPIVALGRRNDR